MSDILTTNIRVHEREGTLEVNRETFRSCLDAIRSQHRVTCENCVIPDYPSSFVYVIDGMKKPFAVAVYPNSKPTRYYILMDRISNNLLAILKKQEKENEDFQNKLRSYVRPARRGEALLGKVLREERDKKHERKPKSATIRRGFRLGQGRYGDIRKAPFEE